MILYVTRNNKTYVLSLDLLKSVRDSGWVTVDRVLHSIRQKKKESVIYPLFISYCASE